MHDLAEHTVVNRLTSRNVTVVGHALYADLQLSVRSGNGIGDRNAFGKSVRHGLLTIDVLVRGQRVQCHLAMPMLGSSDRHVIDFFKI